MSVSGAVAPQGNIFPAFITEPLENAYKKAEVYVKKAHDVYIDGENRLITALQSVLPEEVHTVAQKVARAIPETLFCASMITGTMKIFATLYGVARLIWAATPIIQTALKGEYEGEPFKLASNQALMRLNTIKESLRPAIFVSFGVAAAASVVFGTLSFSPTLAMTGAFLGALSYMSYESMQKPPLAVANEVQGAPASTTPTSSNQGTNTVELD